MLKLLVIVVAAFAAEGEKIQNLTGTWMARGTSYDREFPTTVPGGIYNDLMRQNIIGDVFYGYNDNSTKWVGISNWTYALNFTVDEGLLNQENVNLILEGVDTFATIELNNITLGETKNMFVQYVFDVKNVLKDKVNNTLKVYFANSVERSQNLNNEQLKKYRIPWECPPDVYRGQCHINMIRKMQASFAWDWGPAFPSMGLWKPVYLEAYNESVIRHVVASVEPVDQHYLVKVDTYMANNKRNNVVGTLQLKIQVEPSQTITEIFQVIAVPNEYGEIIKSVQLLVDVGLMRLWYPNGYGNQPLYELEMSFWANQDSEESGISKTIKIAARKVELVQEPLDQGATFYFKINGIPIFAKGSNEIPLNILPELGQGRENIRYLLQSAKEANMNMLRVWGGGVYESDYFYDVADELGIMIWQDFMFACSLYPATKEFLSNVRAEVSHNVKRLLYHPSIVVYSGNNENEAVLADDWYNTAVNYNQYKADYVALYIDTVRSELNRISGGGVIFVSSSPTNGNLSESQGWVGDSPSNPFWGDVHYYNYLLDPWDSNTYPIPRFCSEYGYQSLPFEDSWMTATNNTQDLSISSPFMSWRQHHPLGTVEMVLLIADNLPFPNSSSQYYTSAFIYLSQVYTSQAIRIETEHYRRYRSYLTDDGKGYTMGALYWQLNDVWVAPTWSSIDYTGRWKMLHYFAKNFFENVIVTGHVNAASQLQLYTINDKLSPIENASVLIKIYRYDSPDFTPVYENRLEVTLTGGASELIQTIQTDTFLASQNCTKESCFFHFVVQKNASLTDDVAISPENYVFPAKLKNSVLSSPTLKITSVQKSGTNIYDITVTSDNVVLFVWLDSHAIRGRFSDNGFLQVEASRVVSFQAETNTTAEKLRDTLTVTHLKDPRWA